MKLRYDTFEQYLGKVFTDENPMVIKDQWENYFEPWLDKMETDMMEQHANEWKDTIVEDAEACAKEQYKKGESAGNGSAKHYMNYILCVDVCRELIPLSGGAPRAFRERYNKFREKGNRLAGQLGVPLIPEHDSDDVSDEKWRSMGVINIKNSFFSK